MRYSFLNFERLFVLTVFVLLGAGCGSDGSTAQLAEELFGTWDLVSLEAEGISTDCPGEILLGGEESVSCGTEYFTLSSNGTFAEIETTDELGNPFEYRSEGSWATNGSTLTLTYLREGPNESNLDPINPPDVQSGTWSVSGTSLMVSIPIPLPPFSPVLTTLEKR